MPIGNVKWFDVKKGFGFITGPEGQDVFVHFSSIRGDGFRTLKDGESVEYELLQGEKGFHARNVLRAAKLDVATDGSNGTVAGLPSDGVASRLGVHGDTDGQTMEGLVGQRLPAPGRPGGDGRLPRL